MFHQSSSVLILTAIAIVVGFIIGQVIKAAYKRKGNKK